MKHTQILAVLDSHIGELYQISAILHYWLISEDIDSNTTINIYVTRSRISDEMVASELNWFDGEIIISRFNFVGENTAKKTKEFLSFATNLFKVSSRIRFALLPYDQKKIFYVLCRNILGSRAVCIPHTTGPELYKDDMVRNMTQRDSKKLPVLIKNKLSEKYYYKLGFPNVIVGGDYSSEVEFSKHLLNKLDVLSEKESLEVVLFSLEHIVDMFTYESWVKTHSDIFMCLNEFKNIKYFIKLHPSQSKHNFCKIFSNYIKEDQVVDIHPEPLSLRCDVFISILTSAGHHAINKGKPHANYANHEMRDGVKNFGNAPYPYEGFNSEELSFKEELQSWLNDCIIRSVKMKSIKSKNRLSLLTLRDIEYAISKL